MQSTGIGPYHPPDQRLLQLVLTVKVQVCPQRWGQQPTEHGDQLAFAGLFRCCPFCRRGSRKGWRDGRTRGRGRERAQPLPTRRAEHGGRQHYLPTLLAPRLQGGAAGHAEARRWRVLLRVLFRTTDPVWPPAGPDGLTTFRVADARLPVDYAASIAPGSG